MMLTTGPTEMLVLKAAMKAAMKKTAVKKDAIHGWRTTPGAARLPDVAAQ